MTVVRVRHCRVRAIVRQPWQFEDPDELSTALMRLVADVLAPRLADQLRRVGQRAPFAAVTLRVALPAQEVLGLAARTPVGSNGRHLASFGAELAVHNATSQAVRAALERQGIEPDDPAQAPGSGVMARPAEPDAGVVARPAGDRLALAVRVTLLAAWRQGRLRQLLGRCEPALLAHWARLVAGQRAREPAIPAGPEGVPEDMPAGAAGSPSAAATDAAFEAFLDVLAATAGAWPGDPAQAPGDRLALAARGTLQAAWRQGRLRQLLERCEPALLAHWARLAAGQPAREPAIPAGPEGVPGGEPAGATGSPSAAAADAAFEAFLDVLAATAGPGQGQGPGQRQGPGHRRGPEAGDSPSARAAETAFEAIAGVLAATTRAGPRPGPERQLAPEAADSPSPGAADAAFEAITGTLAATAEARPGPEPWLLREAGAKAPGPGRLEPTVNLEFEVASVLPFLLVGPLDDLGVLHAITAALVGPGAPDLLAAFAACLARKVLPPPGAGWLQPAEVTATVAAFTGQAHAPDGSSCERLGCAVTRWWPVVQESLGAELAGLRAEGAPLVATPSPGGLVLADADGLAPLLWDADTDAAKRLWEDCGRPPVLVHAALAARWQACRPVPDRVHTRPLAELVALAGRRPASGRAGLAPELEAPTGLLAGVGLAALSWDLWHRHGERTHPALAIGRLGDLGGRVRLGPDSVTVQMPIGRRHADLRDSGLLRTVDDVPWLQGRRLELLGG